jgi:soluble lytic murein transglycosylase-like protein
MTPPVVAAVQAVARATRYTPATPAPAGLADARAAFASALARAAGSPPPAPARANAPASPTTHLAVPEPYRALVLEAAQRFRLDPALLAGLIQVESGFRPDIVSPAGAKGLMQLMDATARGLGVRDPFDPRQNILAGAQLLRGLLDRYGGDLRLALAAYNAGGGNVDRYGGVPPFAETQRFIPLVLAAAERFRATR